MLLYIAKGRLTVRGNIRNLSRDGMFIEYTKITCPIDLCVEVGFMAHENGITDEQRVRAYVIHQSNGGIGRSRPVIVVKATAGCGSNEM